jgi:hypothetical protein
MLRILTRYISGYRVATPRYTNDNGAWLIH